MTRPRCGPLQYWQSYQTLSGGQSAALEQYAAGQTVPQDWNAAPLHAGTNMNLIGAANAVHRGPVGQSLG